MQTEPSKAESPTTYFPDEVAVALCLYGPDLEPAEVSELLAATPTHAHRKGDRKSLRRPPVDRGAWIREVRKFEPIDPDQMFDELLAGVSTDLTTWAGLAERFEVRVDFALHTDAGATFVLAPHTMQRIAALGANFQIYIQAYGDNSA